MLKLNSYVQVDRPKLIVRVLNILDQASQPRLSIPEEKDISLF